MRVTNVPKDKSGISTKPNHSKNLVVQETPATQGPNASGTIPQYSNTWKADIKNPGMMSDQT